MRCRANWPCCFATTRRPGDAAAARFGVPAVSFTVKECGGKDAYEAVAAVLKDYQIDFIALAGYLRVVGQRF